MGFMMIRMPFNVYCSFSLGSPEETENVAEFFEKDCM
jgi:hypothetical protein